MVLKVTTLFIILSLFAFYMLQIKPMSEESKSCFLTFSEKMKMVNGQATVEEWEEMQMCNKNRETISLLNTCLETVKSKNFFFPFYFKYPDVKTNYDNTINRHNQVCPIYPISSIE